MSQEAELNIVTLTQRKSIQTAIHADANDSCDSLRFISIAIVIFCIIYAAVGLALTTTKITFMINRLLGIARRGNSGATLPLFNSSHSNCSIQMKINDTIFLSEAIGFSDN